MDSLFIADEVMELSEILVECESLANQFDNLVTARDATLKFENSDSFKREVSSIQFESESNELWDTIKEKIATFLEKVMNFFQVVWSKIQIGLMDFEMRFYKDNHIAIEAGFEVAEKNHETVTIKNWKANGDNFVVSDLITSISSLSSIGLKSFYDVGDKLIDTLLKDPSNTEASEQMSNHIIEGWKLLAKSIGLENSDSIDVKSAEVSKAIKNKYYSEGYISGDKKSIDVDITKFVDLETIKTLADPSVGKTIKKMCDTISSKSSKLKMDLKMVTSSIDKLRWSSDPDKSNKIRNLQSDSMKILMTIQSICKTIGESYLMTYIDFRNDVKKIAKRLASLGKNQNNEK